MAHQRFMAPCEIMEPATIRRSVMGSGTPSRQVGAPAEQAAEPGDDSRSSPSADGVAGLIAEDGTGAGRANGPPEVHGALRNHGAGDNQKERDGQRHSDGGNGHDAEKGRGAVLGNRREELIVHRGWPPGGCAVASMARCSWAISSATGRFTS